MKNEDAVTEKCTVINTLGFLFLIALACQLHKWLASNNVVLGFLV